MPAPKIRIAIVGTGFGSIHAEAFRRDSRCEISAICSTSLARAQEAATRCGAHGAYGNWRQLLEEGRFDALSLATPPDVQAEIGAVALDGGKPVFFEKPLAATLEQAEHLATLAEEHNLPSAINFEFPEISAWREAKRYLDDRVLGRIRHVAVRWEVETYANRHRLESWKTTETAGGGTLNLFTVHTLHYLTWFLGPMRRVTARLRRAAGDTRHGDTLNTLALDTSTGVPVSVTVATDSYASRRHCMDFYCDGGTLRLDNDSGDYAKGFRLFLATRADPLFRDVTPPNPDATVNGEEDGRVMPMVRIVGRFVDAILGGPPCSPGLWEGLRVQRLIAAMRDSEILGRSIDVDDST